MRREHEPLELPTETDRKFGRRLAYLREQAGMSRVDLALKAEVDVAEIEAWEQGQIVIYLDELQRLCRALKMPPDELLGLNAQ